MKRTHSHFSVFLITLAATLVIGGVYLYMHYHMGELISRVAEARSTVISESQKKDHEKELMALYDSTKEERGLLKTYLIPSDKVVTFIEALENLETQAGSKITITNIAADNIEAMALGDIGTVKAHVDAKGSWSSVMRTLHLVEVMPYRTNVERMRIDTSVIMDEKSKQQIREWRLSFDIESSMLKVGSSTPQ